jgi:DNA-binding NarL/FixJ family response regulator
LSAKKGKSLIRAKKRKKPAGDKASEILELVRAGVKRFILDDAPIADFQKAVREASKKPMISSHPLSGVEFRRIVKEAMEQRKKNLARRRPNQ